MCMCKYKVIHICEYEPIHNVYIHNKNNIKQRCEEDYNMKKKFKLEELDCANCAAKMETAINNIDGVKEATISFMTQKLTLEAEDDVFDEMVQKAQEAISKVEKDCKIVLS